MTELLNSTPGVMTLKWAIVAGLALAFAVEVLGVYLRFVVGVQATRDTRWLARFTGGLRIHHGYHGVALLGAAPFLTGNAAFDVVLILGIGLALSDAVHHWVVLWAVTGSPEFDLVYPRDPTQHDARNPAQPRR